jgi:DNA-binding CsgD family transcriptional regulator
MDVVSKQIFAEQKCATECALLLAHASAGIELDEAIRTVIERYLGVDHFSVFFQPHRRPPVILAAGSRDRAGVSSALARMYAARFCRWDSVANDMQGSPAMDQVVVYNRRASDVRNTSYRHECYDKPGINERLTVCSAERGTWRALHLYRNQRSPAFSDADMEEALRAAACILTALPGEPAAAVDRPAGSKSRLPWFLERLRRLPTRLTEREREVCARALIGMTVEGTALELGVAPTSVATYRKRAYQKLNITSQNEMFALLC